ncbi:MAG TPA: NAD(P)/FAD-dependent oxidoreductase [Croceibacterium sp.]|jgi:cation diffusion facilitator CzcD-associated flavoprotein CzcO
MKRETDIDVAIVGAGISGISMAAHLQTMCPGTRFALFERRAELGGTWDLFRYPGVRSDSDMHSLGFRFEPWLHEKAIADGEAILDYLNRIVRERGIDRHIRFGTKVVAADWRPAEARWHLTIEDEHGRRELRAQFLYLASGYYDYDDPHDAQLPGLEKFAGAVIHPQFWPKDLDYSGKRIVVVGSGATAVTIVPAMTGEAAHVTMLQRTPTWMAARPSRDAFANRLQRWLPGWLAHWITRQKNIRMGHYFFRKARSEPEAVGAYLTGKLREGLGEAYSEEHFQPPYGPWQQRLCLVPDDDFFEAVKSGKASIVTGHIDTFERDGVRLTDGRAIPADVVVTATGLRLALGGKIAVSLDGRPVDWTEHWFYRGCLFSNVPNLAVVFGYLNASWTLRADNNADYICRVLNRMRDKRADVVMPHLPEGHGLEEDDIVIYSSGYLQRARQMMPKSAAHLPWRLNQDYLEDCRDFRKRPVDDGVLRFEKLAAPARAA